MTRATSGAPTLSFSGIGFWIAIVLLLILPGPVLRAFFPKGKKK